MKGLPFQTLVPVQLLVSCAEIFGRPQMSETAVLDYFAAVGSQDGSAVSKALVQALRHGDRFPTPHDIRILLALDPSYSTAPLVPNSHAPNPRVLVGPTDV